MIIVHGHRIIRAWVIFLAGIFLLAGSACKPAAHPLETSPEIPSEQGTRAGVVKQSDTPAFTSTVTTSPSRTSSPTQTHVPAHSPTATLIPTSTSTPIPSPRLTPSLTPTYAILRGKVLVQANCRYGPGAAYLYKYGLYPGNNIEIIGRNEPGTWIVIQAIGGTNPCWVKASLLDIKGDVMTVAPAVLPLPMSPYYGPLAGVYAERHGNDVIISWHPLMLRAGDDSMQYPYLIEAWLCQGGKLVFTPIGSWETIITIQDEPGCSEPSHARVYGVEKHGYTRWREVPWPAP
ncbi:MAG: hypothetical protein A2136_02025 [Chloroflexi bacterium RBG_16_54_11]|nr:MAG: hypothetical protein A2136_02025 [Chloroflexi bacterium RBG_16_54_11]